jgi:predicted dehydrogenase
MLRVGIIGTGIIAREHGEAIRATKGRVTLVAASDIDSGKADDFRKAFGITGSHSDATALIQDAIVDLVAITTPPVAHERLVLQSLEAGKYVLCEKPVAHSLASAARISAAADRFPGKLSVSHQLRYHPGFSRIIWLATHGWIGSLQAAVVQRHGSIPLQAGGGWWGAWDTAGGGVLITQLIHELDSLLQVMGKPVSVRADIDTRFSGIQSEDFVDATARFRNGAVARVTASVNAGFPASAFTITGTQGSLSWPWRADFADPGHAARAAKAADAAIRSSSGNAFQRLARRLLGGSSGDALHTGLYLAIEDSISRGEPLPIPVADAIAPLELCMAIYEAGISGEEVLLPLSSGSKVFQGVTPELYASRPCRTTRISNYGAGV